MKRAFFILAGLLIISISANSQYKLNKGKYDFHTYSFQPGDPYRPGNAAVASLIIPGLGQMISGEVGRGFGFLAGFSGCLSISSVGFIVLLNGSLSDRNYNQRGVNTGLALMAAGLIGAISFDLWSVSDAIKVAKVNNMAYRDFRKTSYNLSIKPCFQGSGYEKMNTSLLALNLKISF